MKSAFVIAFAVFLSGCWMPSERFRRASERVATSEKAIATNQTERASTGRDFTYAADYALSLDPIPTKEARVAHTLTSRSLLATGLPGIDDATRLRTMVEDLISTNEMQRVRGQKALEAKDRQLATLQRQAEELGVRLEESERKLRKVNEDNASLADKWARLSRLFWWVVAGAVLIGLGWLATIILPFFVPTVGPALGTMKRLVSGIQAYRHSSNPNEELDDVLKRHLDESDRWRIAQLKRKIGAV